MSSAVLPESPVDNWQQVRDSWVAEVEQMAGEIERWAKENDWDTKRETKEVVEDEIGKYALPVVRIQSMHGRLYFDPIARFLMGASGRVEIIATPSFYQVVLVKENGKWQFLDENLKPLKKTWTREDFAEVAVRLMKKT